MPKFQNASCCLPYTVITDVVINGTSKFNEGDLLVYAYFLNKGKQ